MMRNNESSETAFQAALVECLSSGEPSRLYFPAGDAGELNAADSVLLCQCALVLRAMGEPGLALPADTSDWERYRFLWLRTFHRPVAVRVERQGSRMLFAVKVLDGKGGYDPGQVALSDERPFVEGEWNELGDLLGTARFWSLPSLGKRSGLDGAEWVLEGVRGGDHHFVHRWSPESSGEDAQFRAICLHLLELGTLGAEASPVY